jgi:hypothetical protein
MYLVPSKVVSKQLFFVDILSATDESSRIRICESSVRIRTKMSQIHNTAFKAFLSFPKK